MQWRRRRYCSARCKDSVAESEGGPEAVDDHLAITFLSQAGLWFGIAPQPTDLVRMAGGDAIAVRSGDRWPLPQFAKFSLSTPRRQRRDAENASGTGLGVRHASGLLRNILHDAAESAVVASQRTVAVAAAAKQASSRTRRTGGTMAVWLTIEQ
jgi:hypothetical protein